MLHTHTTHTTLKVTHIPLLSYGEANADKWVMMWRLFFLAVAEMFRYGGGNEWGVAHYLFEKKAPKP